MFHKNDNQATVQTGTEKTCALTEIPQGEVFRVAEIKGGSGLKRRLLALGFHRGDLVVLDGEAPMRGPLLVKNLTSETRVALGRGIASKIIVEPVDNHEG